MILAILYITAFCYLGDRLSSRFLRYQGPLHRYATAFLVGLLLSGWITYLGALNFAWTGRAMLAGNLLFVVICLLLARFLPPGQASAYQQELRERPPGNDHYEWLCLTGLMLLGCWLMLATLNYQSGNFRFAFRSWSDFGANLSLAQSFVLGQNFPSEHPFFAGVAAHYHFLFWFQAANLAYFGLNLAWAVNLLSLLSLLAMLILLMTFAEVLFQSRAVARLSAILFFFASSSLAYIPFLRKQASIPAALHSIGNLKQFLDTGYSYRGEDWGALTVAVFANQRHLISGVGLFLIVLIYLIDRYQFENRQVEPTGWRTELGPLIFCGTVLGLLPYWNSAVFVAAMMVCASLWVLFPFRLQQSVMLGTALLLGLPQVLLFKAGDLAKTGETLLHFGYTIENPTLLLVVKYLAWTFGFKWLLLLIAGWYLAGAQRRLLLAVSVLVPAVFLLKLSTDVFNNHKLLNLWNVFATSFAAYGLWQLGRASKPRLVLAGALGLSMTFGSVIELFPLHNDATITVPGANDRLSTWLVQNTKPQDVFLTHNYLAHPITFTGRKLFLGYTLFAWTAGYDVGTRETIYKQLFAESDPVALTRLFREHNISYVGIDEDMRRNHLVKPANEPVLQQHFRQVFVDTERKYNNLILYQVR